MKRSELKFLRPVADSRMLEVRCGARIAKVVEEAVALSVAERDSFITFTFNGVLMMVRGSFSLQRALVRDYLRACNGYIAPRVGPYVNKTLSSEEKQNDARIRMRNKRKRPYVRAKGQSSIEVSR